MLPTGKPSRAQVVPVLAATVIALACGTNYVYSAWAPQFAQKLKLSSTESNLVGTSGNLGMYLTGIPFGMIVDAKGPRWGVALGTVLFGVGYYPLARAFDADAGAYSVLALCIFSFLTGAGSSSAFTASIKAAALSLPEARGTATAFPLAAFGLSAFFFATLSLAFPHDTSHFLLLLAVGTVVLPVVSFPFLRIAPVSEYQNVPQQESFALQQTNPGTSRRVPFDSSRSPERPDSTSHASQQPSFLHDEDDDTSVHSADSSEIVADLEYSKAIEADRQTELPDLDVRGFSLLRHVEFYQLFCMLGLLAGVGLMTINNIGNDLQALWRYSDPNVTGAFIAKRQAAHVSTLSVCSFAGRLLSGIGSDVLVNRYNRSRLWCLLVSAALFACAQLMATFIELPDLLILVAGVTGIAYGMTFGVYASLVSHAFGIHGMSQNWGTITLAPGIAGNIFNVLYGRIFDAHSVVDEADNRTCLQGRACYSKAYLVTWAASLLGIVLCCWSIYHENQTHLKRIARHQRLA